MTDLTRSQLTTGIIPSQSAEILPYGVFDGSHLPNCSEGDQHIYSEESGKYDLDTVSVFVAKLYQLLDGDEYKEYLTWNDSGDVFVICNMDEFAANVLPKFFKHCKFTSFVRQLNIYGFYRVSDARKSKHVRSKHACVFSHPQFRRGRQDLLPLIRRRVSKPTRRRPPRTNDTDTSFGATTGPKSSANKECSMSSSFVNSENGKEKERTGEEGQMRERIKDLQEVTENLRKDLKQMNSIVSEKLLPEVKNLADGLHRHQQHLVALTQLVTGNFPEGATMLHEALRNAKHSHQIQPSTIHDARVKRLRLDTTMATSPTIKSEPPLPTNLSTASLSSPSLSYSIYTSMPESYKNDDLQNRNHNDPNIMSNTSSTLGNNGMENTNVGAPITMESHPFNQMMNDYQQLSPQQPNAGAHAGLTGYNDSWPTTTTTVMLSDTYAMFPTQPNHSPVLFSPSQPSSAAPTNQPTHPSNSSSLQSNQTQSQPHQSPVPTHSSPQLSSQPIHQQQPSPTPTIALSPTGFVDTTSPHNEHLLGTQGKHENGNISGHASPGHDDLHVGAPSPASPVSSPPEGMTYYQGHIVPINMYSPHFSSYQSM